MQQTLELDNPFSALAIQYQRIVDVLDNHKIRGSESLKYA
jgi:hypothetical protein